MGADTSKPIYPVIYSTEETAYFGKYQRGDAAPIGGNARAWYESACYQLQRAELAEQRLEEEKLAHAKTAKQFVDEHALAGSLEVKLAEQKEFAAALRRTIDKLRETERYWRHEVVTTRLCPVDHHKPHISHDCITKIEERWQEAEQLRGRLYQLAHQLDEPHGPTCTRENLCPGCRIRSLLEKP